MILMSPASFTDEVVPGMFTRQAWEEAVLPSIDTVINERREEMDWVLTDGRQKAPSPVSPEALRQRLTTRYFADFGNAWLNFLNSLHLRKAQTLSDVTEQLTLMADVRQSPGCTDEYAGGSGAYWSAPGSGY